MMKLIPADKQSYKFSVNEFSSAFSHFQEQGYWNGFGFA